MISYLDLNTFKRGNVEFKLLLKFIKESSQYPFFLQFLYDYK